MKTFEFNNQRVYTPSNRDITEADLANAKSQEATIADAYFFQIGPGRVVERIKCDRQKIDSEQSGLYVEISESGTHASLPIAGLERIASFLCDTGTLGEDLSVLKGREVTAYGDSIQIYGIGIDKGE
ncbi:hypothetical protein GOV06_02765 [Candidatus Woesearchaeota archaeon]|nr:hypothetical protein [Candidatus Woesearchaeota archaeon]